MCPKWGSNRAIPRQIPPWSRDDARLPQAEQRRHEQLHRERRDHRRRRHIAQRHAEQTREAADDDQRRQKSDARAHRLDLRHRAPVAEPDRQQQPAEIAVMVVGPGAGGSAVHDAPQSRHHRQRCRDRDRKLKRVSFPHVPATRAEAWRIRAVRLDRASRSVRNCGQEESPWSRIPISPSGSCSRRSGCWASPPSSAPSGT